MSNPDTSTAGQPSRAADDGAPRTPEALRQAAQELLRSGVVDAAVKSEMYRTLLADPDGVRAILEPLDLAMAVDEVRGIAYVGIDAGYTERAGDEWTHPLVRRERLNLEQSLMAAILRRHLIAHETEAGIGAEPAAVDIDDLVPELNQFMGSSGSETQDEHRVRNLLEQLKRHGIVDDVDANNQIRISPLIAHLANPTSLDQLLTTLKDARAAAEGAPE